jgi:predicted ATP-grasp superfamily ATP-dependent carboligase
VLLTVEELAVPTISAFRAQLQGAFTFRLPSVEMVDRLADKALFHELAQRNGLPVPQSVIVAGPESVGALAALTYPVILKPCDKMRVCQGQVDRARVASSLEAALSSYREMFPSAGALLAQEWVEGPDSNIYFCLFYRGRSGAIVRSFVGRKIMSHPPGIGSTAICGPAQEHRAEIERLTHDFVERVEFDGMGSIEYKLDSERQRLFVIEPTVGRTDWQEEIATLCGCNIPLAAYCHETGTPLPREQPANRLWRASAARRLPHWIRDKAPIVVDGYWRANDPVPAILHYLGSVPRFLRDHLGGRGPRRPPASEIERKEAFRTASLDSL